MRKLLTGAIALTIAGVVAGGVFYACKKDSEVKVTKDLETPTALVNPMEQYGKWHNECMNYIYSQPNVLELTFREVWEMYGDPFFDEHVSVDTRVPIDELIAAYNKIKVLLNNNNTVSLIDDLAEKGKLNKTFSSPYITENNYTILHNFFSYMDAVLASSSDHLSLDVIVEYEQQMLSNYYSLVEHGVIVTGNELCAEYNGALMVMAIARNSVICWDMLPLPPPNGTYAERKAEHIRAADAAAAASWEYFGLVGSSVRYTSSASSNAYSDRI